MSTATSQALLPTVLLCTGGMCGHKLWLFFFFYHFVWLYEVTFLCFILVAQKSCCCLIRSTPSLPPTGTRMYNLTMSLENTPRADRNLAFFFHDSCEFSDCLSRMDQNCAGERPVHPLPQALQRWGQDDPGRHEDQLSCILLQSERAISLFPLWQILGTCDG